MPDPAGRPRTRLPARPAVTGPTYKVAATTSDPLQCRLPVRLAREHLVHHLGTCGDHSGEFGSVDELSGAGLLVPGHPGDLLHRHATTDMMLTNVCRSSRGT